jgi:hypothetical protein
MELPTLKLFIEVISGIATLGAGLLVGLWAYTKYVLERSLLPPVQFDTECGVVGRQKERILLEVLVHLKNVGSSALVAKKIRLDLRYLDERDEVTLFDDPTKAAFGRLRFPRSLPKDLASNRGAPDVEHEAQDVSRAGGSGRKERGIPLVLYDTFVQPGVDQAYPYVTTVPRSARFVLVWSSFQYAQRASQIQRVILLISRRLGLLQYSLTHVCEPHTMERVFPVGQTRSENLETVDTEAPRER